MRRNSRHLFAVVMGGKSGRARNARMRTLLEGHIQIASARRTSPRLVEVAEAVEAAPRTRVAAAAPSPRQLPAPPMPSPAPAAEPEPRHTASALVGSADPIKPLIVRTVTVRKGPAQPAVTAMAPAQRAPAVSTEPLPPVAEARQAAPEAPQGATASIGATGRSNARKGWVIQVGAFPAEEQARSRLRAARSVGGKALSGAESFTETVVRGDVTLFRARFAGFDRDQAQAVCRHFKRNEISCLALRQE